MPQRPKPTVDLDALRRVREQYDTPSPAPTPPAAPGSNAARVTIRISDDDQRWLLHEAARRQMATGERHDVSRIIRDLIATARATGTP